METVSFVVPTYNQAQYVKACLDSIWFQEYPHIEIIIINDGSSDNTTEVLNEYIQAVVGDKQSFATRYNAEEDTLERLFHPRYPAEGRSIHVLTHETNKGLASALNTGFRAATGRFVTYVPSDDVCYPHMTIELVDALTTKNADFSYADMFVVNQHGGIVRRFSLPDYSFERCFGDWYLCGVCKMYKRELHAKFGWYDETLLAHDHALFQKFAMAGARFVHVPKVLMGILDHSGEREVDIHSPDNWNRLLNESRELVHEARRFVSGHK